MKTENVAESHQTDIPYTFPAGNETSYTFAQCEYIPLRLRHSCADHIVPANYLIHELISNYISYNVANNCTSNPGWLYHSLCHVYT